jgi:phosphoglycerate dehydrogenase-like enzyme
MDTNVTIAVTQPEYEKGKTVFEQAAEEGLICLATPREEAKLAAAIREQGARHAILGVEQYVERLYDALPRGGVLARFGVGYDSLDLPRATERGLLCVNTPGALDDSVAEHTLALMLSAARHVPVLNERTRQGTWVASMGAELRGKQLAVIGCGPIGCRVARCAAFGFGMEVIGSEVRDVDAESMKREFGFAAITKDFAEAVRHADVVSLHIPGTPAMRHFVDGVRLAEMPSKAWLINTGRGVVVDEAALFDALESSAIRGAALDVFEAEPYVPVDPGKDLRTLPNVIMTPHVASSTVEACGRMAARTLQNIRLAERKEYREMDLLNPEVLHHLGKGRNKTQ